MAAPEMPTKMFSSRARRRAIVKALLVDLHHLVDEVLCAGPPAQSGAEPWRRWGPGLPPESTGEPSADGDGAERAARLDHLGDARDRLGAHAGDEDIPAIGIAPDLLGGRLAVDLVLPGSRTGWA